MSLKNIFTHRGKSTLTHLNTEEKKLVLKLVAENPNLKPRSGTFTWHQIETLSESESSEVLYLDRSIRASLFLEEKRLLDFVKSLREIYYINRRQANVLSCARKIWERSIVRLSLEITQIQEEIKHLKIYRHIMFHAK